VLLGDFCKISGAASVYEGESFPITSTSNSQPLPFSIPYSLLPIPCLMLQRLRPLFPYLRRYWRSFALGLLALLVYNGSKALIPLVIGHAVTDMQHGLDANKIVHQTLILLGIAIIAAVALYLTRQIIIGASREIEFDLRNDLFAHLSKQPPEFFQRHRTGDIMARSTNDLNAVRQLLGPAIMYSANTIVFTAAALPFMLRISPHLTLYAFLPLPFASVLVQYFGARIHTRFERIQAMFSDISAQAEENFSGARLIRAFAQEEAQIAAFETSNLEYIRRSLLLARLMAMLWPTLEFVLGISIMITLLVGGHEVVAHNHDPRTGITVAQFTTYMVYMVQLTWPMIAIGWVVNLVQRGTASVVRIHEIMLEKPSIDDSTADPALSNFWHPELEACHPERSEGPASVAAPNLSSRPKSAPSTPQNLSSRPESAPSTPQNLSSRPESALFADEAERPAVASALLGRGFSPDIPPSPTRRALAPEAISGDPQTSIQGHIHLNHLHFSYPTGPEVLHDITLDIPAGSSLAIVGPTGSGKSTLVALIPRLYDAPSGEITLDDRPLRDYPLATLRESIGFVPQETFLFSTTIADNIAFGDKQPGQSSPEDIQQAASTAYIATEILEFPHRFSTIVGERGMTLSGGQKQRTAIARAILRDPRILILDDALASVDTNTEDQILTGLRSAMHGRTTILIAHRVSTARNADRIAVLEAGRITELGTHDELLVRKGYYADLFEKQSLEEEILTA
jgi:ABC-type multidrug transport system fused ATPase/permease subunit